MSTRSHAGRSALITVRAALGLPAMRRGVPEVLASERNLDRSVRWVHAGEVPNMASLLKGGELLLTTGMGLQVEPQEQRRFIADLADRNVAALAIELGSTFATVPQPIVEEAEQRGLPLIALHREVAFVEITEALHREIVNRQFVAMRRSEELHQRFTELVLEGAGIPEVLSALSSAVANPIVLHKDGAEGVLYHATHLTGSSEVLAAWDAASQRFSSAPPVFWVDVPTTGHERWGKLAAIALDSPLDDFDRVAVERAVEVIALVLLRNRQEDVLAGRERGNFLAELLARELSESDAVARAGELGFARSTRFLLPLAVARSPRVSALAGAEQFVWASVWREVQRELTALGIPSLAGTRSSGGELLLIVGLDDAQRRAQVADRIADLLQTAASRHLHAKDAVIVCVGAQRRSWGAAAEELEGTIEAAAAAAHGPSRAWHDVTSADTHRLFWTLRDEPALRAFVASCLAPILEHDAQRKSKLLPTLEAYCAHGGRKAETARSLHLERQSLYHRLERIESLLGRRLSDDGTVFALHLALRARSYVDLDD